KAIHRDPDGVLWFGTGAYHWAERGGVSRFDAKSFVNFTTKDGLPHNFVFAIHRDPDGMMWFGTFGGGVSRYDGKEFITFTTKDGLAHNWVSAIYRDPDGVMWFGTGGGVSRYDGKEFINFTARDGLPHNYVLAILREPDGVTWFGTGGGVSRYDGEEFKNFTTKDGLAHNFVFAIHRDPNGVMWFGTMDGVSRYDGKEFVNFTRSLATSATDGSARNLVYVIHVDRDGVMWFGTFGGGVSRYDGKEFINFTTKDGLAHNTVWSIHSDPDGVMWFGTDGGGVSRYDGAEWTSLDIRDGLAGNTVSSLCRDSDGSLWFATDKGVTRYRRSNVPPKVNIVSVTTDQTYFDISAIPASTPGTRATVEYNAIDFVTVPEKRLYRCRIKEIDTDWRKATKATSFDYTFDNPGVYTFQVQAIDRDMNYSESATVSLTVQPDPLFVALQTEVDHLRSEVGRKYHFSNIIGRSASMKQVYALMERAIDSGLTVLISGETGTGKELVAKAIHYNSPRKNKQVLPLNCGAESKELIASKLFGHRRGAFTGAHEDRIGLFESALGGTVLLDEIGEMPQDAQVHLLRVLEERTIQRLGENTSRDVDVRIISMTNRDLAKEVTAGRFREDLYYRLSEFPIPIQPLRERLEDIPILAEHFLQEIDKELDGFAPDVFDMLASYSWPGNVRELRNVIRRAAAFVEEGMRIHTYHFPPHITQGESLIQEILSERTGLPASVERLQQRLIEDALRKCDGNRTQAARMLEMHRPNLIRLMKRLGIE
ncbi:sigma 54-interacting transcriptional regulator, partial [bacterium]|nr:sigma 54-interacting transcriptional regulator [bacterium]